MNMVKRLGTVRKPVLITVCIVLVAAIAGVVFLVVQMNTHKSTTTTTVQSSTAQKGNVNTTVTGSGTLAAGTTTNIEVPTGIKIDSVAVASGDVVTAGQTLATLNTASIASELIDVDEEIDSVQDEIDALGTITDTSTTEYLQSIVLNSNLSDLQAKQARLATLLENPVITASSDGTIGTVSLTAGSETSSGSSSSSSSSSSSGSTASKASYDLEGTATQADYSLASASADSSSETATTLLAMTYDEATLAKNATLIGKDSTVTLSSDGTSIVGLDLEVQAPVTGEKPESKMGSSDAYTSNISWNCTGSTFQGDTEYTATITLTAKSGFTFYSDIVPTVTKATVNSSVMADESGTEGKVLVIKAKFAKTSAYSGSSSATSSTSSSNTASVGSASTSGGTSSSGASSSSGTSSSSGSSGASSSSSTSSSSTSTSTVNTTDMTGFTIISNDDATVTLSINEDDILSIKKGQSAKITLDALDDQSFTGTVTSVSGSSTSSSSSSTSSSSSSSVRYKVVVTVPRTSDMKIGMSASATISINESDNAVLIPSAALQERGNTTFVYTSLDSSGNPSGETTVETGLSDGSNVEVTSGLSEGTTVYYTKTTTSNSDSSTSSQNGGMGAMGAMSGGSAPSGGGGGSAPSGSGGSGGGPGGSGGSGSGKSS